MFILLAFNAIMDEYWHPFIQVRYEVKLVESFDGYFYY